jgi:hypothetical protein
MADKVKFVVVLSPIYSTNIFEGGLSRSAGTLDRFRKAQALRPGMHYLFVQ